MSRARVLFSTGSLYILDTAQSFALAAEAGFDGIEIMCDERYSTRDPRYLRRLSEQHSLPVLAAHTPFSPRIPGWGAAHDEVNRIERTLELAEALDCEAIVVHVPRKTGWATLSLGYKSYRFPWRTPFGAVKHWIERDLRTIQARTKVKIALENMPARRVFGFRSDPTWWNEPETWGRVHDYLTLDTTHWGTKGIDPLAAYHAAAGRVWHVHLSNYDGEEHRLPHKGRLDLAALLRVMAADDYGGTISLELSPGSLEFRNEDLLKRNLRDSLAFVREHLTAG